MVNFMKKLSKIFFNFLICCLVTSIATISVSAVTYFIYEDFKYSISNGKIAINSYIGNSTNIVVPETILGDTVVSIDELAFSDMSNVKSVTLPDTLTKINRYAFNNMTSLESIVIPENCSSLSVGLFQNCTSLKSVTVKSEIPYVVSQMFTGCTSLKEFIVPDSVKSIASFAFADCTSLEKVVIPDSVTKIAANSFKNCSNLTIYGNKGSYAEQYATAYKIPFEALDSVLVGDINLDGYITVNDATMLQRYLVDMVTLTDDSTELLDFNKDEKINIMDVTAIQMYIAANA